MKRCLLGLVCLIFSIHSFSQTLESDRLALVAIYTATSTGINDVYGDANFNDITGWNIPGSPGDSPCGWTGVTCEGGRVTGLDLSLFQVHGPLAPEVGNLSELKYLNIRQGGAELLPMTGNIPVTLGSLQKLEYLEMRGNGFSGRNLYVIGSLTNLTYLALNTPTSWTVPDSFENLANLEHLFIGVDGEQAFPVMGSVGSIPSYFGNFTKLKTLSMPWAGASGTIPASLGNLTDLEVLDLHNNNLTGQIPVSFNNLTKLTLLDLSKNELTGPIPNILGIPVAANVNISGNAFNFSGMEFNISRLDQYLGQALIDAYLEGPLCVGCLASHIRVATAGGSLANNTYKLFKNNVLLRTQVGNDWIELDGEGIYRVEVTNGIATALTLVTKTYTSIRLPVTLVSFEGKSESNQTKLTWKTASETNNKGFEIERSADAQSFETIGFVDGSGDSKENQFYHFTDLDPLPMTYYRLKQLDYDGKFEYSKVIAVKALKKAINIYPNPAQGELTVEGVVENELVWVWTPTGKPVMAGTKLSRGKLDVKNLKEGIYTIKIGDAAKKLLIKR